MRQTWLAGPSLDPGALTAIPLFRTLTPRQSERLLSVAREQRFEAGDVVVREWEYGKLFYVILDGVMEVRAGAGVVVTLGPGDFFGENAALDWGAGYGYARTASVVAGSRATLLAVQGAVLDELYRTVPDVERQLRAAMRERIG